MDNVQKLGAAMRRIGECEAAQKRNANLCAFIGMGAFWAFVFGLPTIALPILAVAVALFMRSEKWKARAFAARLEAQKEWERDLPIVLHAKQITAHYQTCARSGRILN